MATMILLPDGSSSVSDWTPAPFPNTISAALDDDNGDTSYVKSSHNNATMTIEYASPSVQENDIESIDSVRYLSSGRSTNRSLRTRVAMDFEVPSGNPQEVIRYDPHASNYTTVNGTARAYSDGSSAAWTYANLVALELKCTKVSTIEVYLSYLALEVTYTPAVTVNATFFGANF